MKVSMRPSGESAGWPTESGRLVNCTHWFCPGGGRPVQTQMTAAARIAAKINTDTAATQRPRDVPFDSKTRCRRFKSAATSAAVWYRSSVAGSSSLKMIRSSSGFTLAGGGSVQSRVFEKARRPVAISYSTAPKENRSVRASTFSPRACSGDI